LSNFARNGERQHKNQGRYYIRLTSVIETLFICKLVMRGVEKFYVY